MLYKKLEAYGNSDYYGFHMPGHKRNPQFTPQGLPYRMDITEIDGFDDLHHADGILKEAQERASRLYHSGETHFLINGSTVGILSAVLGCTKQGDKILMARNCHKSVYHAVFLNGLEPVYLYPEYLKKEQINGEVSGCKVRDILKKEKNIRAVVIVSPTYDGVISDVRGIAEAAHEKGIPLIVDEAHGAHFGFERHFPRNANELGADIVIHSLHKTLPSMTQTALLHMNGEMACKEEVRRYLHMLQSSSPSYILMASMDSCMELLEKNGESLFQRLWENLERFRTETKGLRKLNIIATEHFDPSKILISAADTGISGRELSEKLQHKYHLQMEMAADSYVLAMTSICDTQEGFVRLKDALYEIDAELCGGDEKIVRNGCKNAESSSESLSEGIPRPEYVLNSAGALRAAKENGTVILPVEKSEGRISTEYAYLYPPGIPFIVPGERISRQMIQCLIHYRKTGFTLEGLSRDGRIEVLALPEKSSLIQTPDKGQGRIIS